MTMNEKPSRTKRVAAAGLAAGMAGLPVNAQSPKPIVPPAVLPIPELPKPGKLEFPELGVERAVPNFAETPPLASREELPQPGTATPPAQPNFNLQPAPGTNNLTFEAMPRDGLPGTIPIIPALPPAASPTFSTMSPREADDMTLVRKAILSAALGAFISALPATAQDKDGKEKIPAAIDAVKQPDVKKELEDVKTLLNGLIATQKQIGETVLGKGEGKGLDAGLAQKMETLAASIKTLEETVKKLDDKMTKLGENVEKVRTANSSPLVNQELTKYGIVKLVNNYGERVTLILNGQPHRLENGETKDVNVPTGSFQYALPLAGGELKTSSVKDNEIVTLRIR
jgi:chaperonin cofactor prefoldin